MGESDIYLRINAIVYKRLIKYLKDKKIFLDKGLFTGILNSCVSVLLGSSYKNACYFASMGNHYSGSGEHLCVKEVSSYTKKVVNIIKKENLLNDITK